MVIIAYRIVDRAHRFLFYHSPLVLSLQAQYVFIHKSMQEIIDSLATFGPGGGSGTGLVNSSSSHFPRAYGPGYSSVYCNRESTHTNYMSLSQSTSSKSLLSVSYVV